ncbi:MAG TPA: TadE/TadG family type IV pilus assembly protein [Herpetosiphonaceae bacterium]|nr:TadE/TadG family type IV pilus assembly protein [Herpetosiphonaceae bacterium]
MKQLKAYRRRQGQTLVLFAVMLVPMLGMVGLGIDGAYLYTQRRALQGAADLSALAGSLDLPSSTDAKASATLFAGKNGYTNGTNATTVVATSPYQGPTDGSPNPDKIEVVITRQFDTFFMPVLGIDEYTVAARAVAVRREGDGEYLVFAMRHDCSQDWNNNENVYWSGSNNTVNGRVHSNSGITVSGGSHEFGVTTYVCDDTDGTGSGKEVNVNVGTDQPFNGEALPTETAPILDWPTPAEYTQANFRAACDADKTVVGTFDLTSYSQYWSGGTLEPGVYCALNGDGNPAKLNLSGSNLIAHNVTFYSDDLISVSGSAVSLTPRTSGFTNGVLMAAWGGGGCAQTGMPNKSIEITGSGVQWNGILFAPEGQANVSGSDGVTILGSVVGCVVQMSGSDMNLTGVVGGGDFISQLVE